MKKKHELQFDEIVFDGASIDSIRSLEVPPSRFAFGSIGVLMAAILILVLGRIFFLYPGKASFYVARASANAHESVIVSARRGVITDRFGVVLAKSKSSFSVVMDITRLPRGEDPVAYLAKLAETLGLESTALKEVFYQADFERTSVVPLVRNITSEEAIAVDGLNIPVFKVIDDFEREYVKGPIYAHVLGYVGADTVTKLPTGKTGIEAVYDDILRGLDGTSLLYRDARGKIFDSRVTQDPEPGATLRLTLDADLQEYFYDRMRAGLRSLGKTSGVGLALDPKTGEILALISLPSFDNNVFVQKALSGERLALLNNSSKPLFNRAVSGIYNPGSAIKPLVALAALKERIVTPEEQFFSAGFIEVANPYDSARPSRFVDWKAHGWVDVKSALARSSNIYFYAVGGGLLNGQKDYSEHAGLGIARLREYWQKFGFGEKTGVDLTAENSGFLPDPEEKEKRTGQIWRIGDTYNASIGQGDLLVTPLQLAAFTASIASGGKLYKPHLVASETEVDLPVLDYSSWARELALVQEGMEDAVHKPYGTASLLYDLPVYAAGKTGSAQFANNTKTNAFFVGYAPTKDPRIALLVLVEDAKGGSLNAVPIAKEVLAWYYEHRIAGSRAVSNQL